MKTLSKRFCWIPYYILIDDKKKIVKMYAKLDEVEALLSQEKK